MSRYCVAWSLALLSLVMWGSDACAQRTGMGSGGMGGMGSGIGGGGFGQSGFGGGMGGGRGSTGGGLGGMGGGMGGMGGGMGSGMGGMGMGQMGMGQMGFGSGNTGGFIGRDAADVTAMFESMNRQATQQANRSNRGATGQNRDRGNQPSQEASRTPVRIRLKVGFDHPQQVPNSPPPIAVFETQMDRIIVDRKVSNFGMSWEGGHVILTGIAFDASERMLVEQIVGLDPAVSSVENRMTIAEPLVVPTPQETSR